MKVEGFGDGFRGKFNGMSFYKMRGVNGTVARKSGGHTKAKIKDDPNLEKFRRAEGEFGGRAAAAKYIMHALIYQKPLADYNIAGPLTKLLKPVQEHDTDSEYGKRNVRLSANAHYLKGFSLNKTYLFDAAIKYPVNCILDRSALAATVYFPELIPEINFTPTVNYPYYSLRVSLGIVPDIVHTSHRYTPIHLDYPVACAVMVDTPWAPLLQRAEAREVSIVHDLQPPDENFTPVLSVGIRYGILTGVNQIDQVRHAGSAKVLEVG